MPENSYTLFQICAHLCRIKHVGICWYRRIEKFTKSWNWEGRAAACKIKLPEEMVCIALEFRFTWFELPGTGGLMTGNRFTCFRGGSPGLKFEVSGGFRSTARSAGKQVHLF